MPTSTTNRVAEISLRYTNNIPLADRQYIPSSAHAFNTLWPMFAEHHEAFESFRVMLLDRANRLKGIYTVSQGGVAGTIADPKLIFSVALRTLSSGIIVAHNHPSGQCRPSEQDILLTKKLCDGARLLDIVLNDHVIVAGPDSYFSFADNGMLA